MAKGGFFTRATTNKFFWLPEKADTAITNQFITYQNTYNQQQNLYSTYMQKEWEEWWKDLPKAKPDTPFNSKVSLLLVRVNQ